MIGEETFSKRKELLMRVKLKRVIKTNAVECDAVWITDMGILEKTIYIKTPEA